MGKDEETEIAIQSMTSDFWKQMKLDGGAKRLHYSMFKVGRSMFNLLMLDVHLLNPSRITQINRFLN
jgi:hypothetical protein